MKTLSKMTNKSILKQLFCEFKHKKHLTIFSVVFAILSALSILLAAYMFKPIVNNDLLTGNLNHLLRDVLILGAIYVCSVLFSSLQIELTIQLAYQVLGNLKNRLFKQLQKLPISYFDSHSSGDTMSLFTNDAEAIQVMLEQSIIMVISNVLQIIGTLAIMLMISRKLFFISCLVSLVIIFVTIVTGQKSQHEAKHQTKLQVEVNSAIEEIVEGIETIKTFQYQTKTLEQFDQKNKKYKERAIKSSLFAHLLLPLVNSINTIHFTLITTIGALLVLNQNLDIGSLAVYMLLTINFNQPFKQLSMQVPNIVAGFASWKRVFTVLLMENEVDSGDVAIKSPKEIEFQNVDFSYNENQKVLQNINFTVQRGEKIAFVGSTGSGKTTIANLLNRFYEVDSGVILFDGIDIRKIKRSELRLKIGVVFQETYLFTGTIMENIRYGNLAASDEEVIMAAKLTCADQFISQLPEKYQTKLIKNGENISAGQKQLIAIARTAIASPDILILDEATSAIDTRTEAYVTAGLNRLMKGRTVFVIAHRLSTIKDADKIAVLNRGKIIEFGNHQELLAKRGMYFKLLEGKLDLE